MRSSARSIFVPIVAILGISVPLVMPAAAAMAPEYRTWQDFAAVVGESSIPRILGEVDRIERTPQGNFIVRAGACFVEVTVQNGSFIGPDGRPYVGGTHVTKVDVGEKHCN